ncbi:MAG: response regulator [Gemmatimonadaceae bacterium]|nr:response regulator [Gemmatimonadaceae bacterium]
MVPSPYPADPAFRAIADALDDAVFIVDEWWRVQWHNAAAGRLMESSGIQRDGGEFLALFGSTTRERIVLDGAVGAGERWCAEGEIEGSGVHAVAITIAAMDGAAPPGWRSAQLRDLGEVRALESSLREARTLERVGRLALALSHEFSELLTAISGSADLIASELAPRDRVRGDVETIRESAERAAVLMRELSRAAQTRTTAPQRIDIARAIAALETTVHRIAGDRVQLVLDLAPNAGQGVIDLSQLEASILHLARNARDAMPDGGELRIVARAIDCQTPRRAVHAVMRPGRYACIEVRDTGHGMAASTLERCFEPLFSTRGGEGLGLSLVFGATAQMGGYVTCDSRPGDGTSVALYLPTLADAPARALDVPAFSRSVLVVDDEEVVRRIAARTLRREGYRVSEAAGADEALALVSRDPSVADLLVTDVLMPGLSGVELASCMVAARPDVRILFSSGASALDASDASRLPRGAAFLPKPFTPKALGDRVRSIFGL